MNILSPDQTLELLGKEQFGIRPAGTLQKEKDQAKEEGFKTFKDKRLNNK